MTELRLGLIGDNISRSRSPLLHRLAGRQNGIRVRYDSLIPTDLGQDFEEVFESCRQGGYRGLNITYPYKERVVARVAVDDPLVRAMGTVNTVTFEADGPHGTSTDYTGFVAAYRAARADRSPGTVLMIGTGGVGRAVAFGLVGLGAPRLRLLDRDTSKSEALVAALRDAAPDMEVGVWTDAAAAADGAAGLINCTPVGMHGHDGTPLSREAMDGADWAFDAVYTPAETRFLSDASAEGLQVISGWELFFWQGVHAWRIFSGRSVDEADLRRALTEPQGREARWRPELAATKAGPLPIPHLGNLLQRARNLAGRVGLRKEQRAFGKVGLIDIDDAGGDDDRHLGPPVADEGGQRQPVHFARHVHVGEQDADVVMPLQQRDRLFGGAGPVGPEPGILDHRDGFHLDQRLVLHDQNGRARLWARRHFGPDPASEGRGLSLNPSIPPVERSI